MTKAQMAERQEHIERLHDHIKPGDSIFTVLKHVSKSGMYRVIDVYRMDDNEPIRISFGVAIATDMGYDRRHEGVKAQGCGMDMGFEVVYQLSSVLFPDGFDCTGDKCPSNDHHNRVERPTNACTGEGCQNLNCVPWRHSSGGYALRHKWM
jgi:hypothetical protein